MHGIKESHLNEIVLSEIRNVTEFARERTDEFAEFISHKSNTSAKKELVNADKKLKKCEKRLAEVETIFRSFMKIMCLEQLMTSSSECCRGGIPRSKISLKLIFRS